MPAFPAALELLNSDPRRGKVGIDRGDAWRTSDDHESSCALLLWRRKEGFVVKVFSVRIRVEMDGKRIKGIYTFTYERGLVCNCGAASIYILQN